MSDTLERELRRTLAEHAPSGGERPDAWDRVQRGLVTRRRRRTGAVAGSLALAVAVGGGLAVVQPWGGQATDTDVAEIARDPREGDRWALDDGEPRGALAGDAGLLADVEDRLGSAVVDELGGGAQVVPGSTHLVFADDVRGTRLVVGVGEVESAGGDGTVKIELTGTAGTPVGDLALASSVGGEVDGLTWPVVGVVTDGDGPGLLAVVPRGAQVTVSQAAVVSADGEVSRDWAQAEVSADGVVDVPLDDPLGSGLAVLRIDTAPGFPTSAPVAELALPWPGTGLAAEQAAAAAAAEVVDRGPRQFRDPLQSRGGDDVVADVRGAMAAFGNPPADDVELLYASDDGADVDRGASGWSSLVATRAGDGAYVSWQLHDADGAVVASAGAAVPQDAVDRRVLLRATLDDGREVVGVWDAVGDLGSMTIDGQDAFLPLAVGFRWFPVATGADVVVDGTPVPQVQKRGSSMMWVLGGEEHPGPDPLYAH